MVLKNHASALKSQLSDHTAVEKRQLQDHKAALKALSTEQDKKLQALVDQHALDSSSTAIQLHTLRQQVEQHRGETASVRAAYTQEGQAALNDLAAQLKGDRCDRSTCPAHRCIEHPEYNAAIAGGRPHTASRHEPTTVADYNGRACASARCVADVVADDAPSDAKWWWRQRSLSSGAARNCQYHPATVSILSLPVVVVVLGLNVVIELFSCGTCDC